MHGRRVAPRAFPSQRQAFLGIHPIKALFPDLPPFPLQQDTETTVAESDAGLRELSHPCAQRRQRVFATVVLRGDRVARITAHARRALTA